MAEQDDANRKFRISLQKYANRLPKLVGQLQRKAAFDVMDGVVAGSPVDTGLFQNSWFPGVGRPGVGEVDPKTVGISKQAAKAISVKRLTVLTPENVNGKVSVHITNNLPYGPALADGHSHQAPSGWITGVLQRVRVELGLHQFED